MSEEDVSNKLLLRCSGQGYVLASERHAILLQVSVTENVKYSDAWKDQNGVQHTKSGEKHRLSIVIQTT